MTYKVMLISGSPRKKGNSMAALKLAAEELQAAGLETEIVSLAGMDIGACRACSPCQCGSGGCIIKDGANEIYEKIREADGLILAAPVYYGTPRGDIMNFIQRLGMYSARNGRFLEGKVGGPIAVARRGGHTAALNEMLMFCYICGMVVCGSHYWNMMVGMDPGDVLDDEEGVSTVRTFAKNVARTIKKLRD
ncbi:MAG: flavodoxin family protein [Firmicutes bacterium]|nr:flavodoxin family protein [Bacillota bacterium]